MARTLLAAFALFTAASLPAQASETAYGLTTETVKGVQITRGTPKPLPKRVAQNTPRTGGVVRLDRGYRGKIFGKHRIVRDGQLLLRSDLLPVRQRGDE
ncbi:MAG: hypothetical protein AAF337_08005 [Pseudomonadota bacterium]